VLVGNSIGCATSLAIAATYLQMVRGIATIGLPNVSSIEELIPKVMGLLLDGLKKICSSRWLLKMLFYFLRYPCVIKHWPKMAYARQEAITEELIEIFTAPVSDRYCIKVFFTMSEAILGLEFYPCIRSCLSKLQIPSLLFWGQRDRMIPHGVSKRFLNYNPGLQLIEIENTGHCARDEYPEQVNQQLLLWIQTQVLNSYVQV
jgi:pimeloyl-ACP methyl ester carboxylesterase